VDLLPQVEIDSRNCNRRIGIEISISMVRALQPKAERKKSSEV